jgi:hypothetical protein
MSKGKQLPVTVVMANGYPMQLSEILKITDAVEQNAAIQNYLDTRIAAQGAAFFHDIHAFAIFAMAHAMAHNNSYVYMDRLVLAVEGAQGARHNKLITWFEEHSPASYDKEKQLFRSSKVKTNDNWKIVVAEGNPYYKSVATPKSDLYTLENLIAALEKAVKKTKSDKADATNLSTMLTAAMALETQVLPLLKAVVTQPTAEAV